MLKFLLTIVLFGFVSSLSDYCDPNLCPKGSKHIACKNYGNFVATCPADRKMVSLTVNDIKVIVAQHNKLRNRIASGAEVGFKSASRMATMVNLFYSSFTSEPLMIHNLFADLES